MRMDPKHVSAVVNHGQGKSMQRESSMDMGGQIKYDGKVAHYRQQTCLGGNWSAAKKE